MRGAIVAAAVMPAIAALVVYLVVPRDEVARTARAEIDTNRANGAPWWRLLSVQFGLAIFVYFFLFAADQLIRTLTPIAIEDIEGHKATGVVGIAFTLSGVASVLGVAVVARRFVRQGRLGLAVAAGCALAGAAYVLLAFALAVPLYVTWFCVIAMVQGAVLPASNTLIAANIDRSRRGTAFGLAASAQALAFMVGPFGATAAAAISIRAGYVVLGALFVGMAMLTRLAVREPVYEASEGGAR